MSPHRVVVLVLPDVVAFDLGVPGQIFGGARDAADRRLYRVDVCTPGGAPVRSASGFTVTADRGLGLLDEADTVVVPGVHDPALLDRGELPDGVGAALRRASARGARVMSICTGAFALAAAGLLDGRRATTHWLHADEFRLLFPQVELDPGVLFVDGGDVLTSAGVAAGIDLCLHVVRADHGSEVANRAARRSVVPSWRPGGQAQFIDRPLPRATGDSSTATARAWALEHLDEPLDLRALAERARMSVRTFTRRFREETGTSPGDWLLGQRVDRARRLLETTDLPVDQVARHAGFGTGAALRQRFAAVLGVSPSGYRTTFRSAG